MNCFNVIGLMSGTSLDGLDIANCTFEFKAGRWTYRIAHFETVNYSQEWRLTLSGAAELSDEQLNELDESYGRFLGDEVVRFIRRYDVKPDFVSSHGHTVIHQPEKRISVQIGNGKTISETCGFPVVNDFRRENVEAGGQGAPLVPIGDRLLFPDFSVCLNLGGIANVSTSIDGIVQAFDISICNLAFNHFASLSGMNYDVNGELGRSGKMDESLFHELNGLKYFHFPAPKSLDASFFKKQMLPLVNLNKTSIADCARTFYEHLAFQIMSSVKEKGPVLITGGGAHNIFLIDLITQKGNVEISLADNTLIDYKEALIFAFLGVLRIRGEVNCLASVTGSPQDMCTGKMHGF